MKRAGFDDLMHRYVTGKVSEQERAKIEAWLNVMKAERTTDLNLSEEDEDRILRRITNSVDSVEDVVALYPHQRGWRRMFSKSWIQVAASVVVLLSLAFAGWGFLTDFGRTDAFSSDKTEKLVLNDGTLVWLEPGSKFTFYQREDGTRNAALSGEALFEVAKIPNSIFLLTCGDIAVKVLGTSFNVKTADEHIELKVLTGSVNLSSRADSTGIDVDHKEKVIYTTAGDVERMVLNDAEIAAITAHTEYDMTFRNTTMEEVIARIENKFDVEVVTTEAMVRDCRVTIDLTDISLDGAMTMLTEILDIRYEVRGNEVEVSGRGCH